MYKAERKFRMYAVLAVFVLLLGLLTVINGVNFTMVGEDADRITQMIADRHGAFGQDGVSGKHRFAFDRMGPMGPDSPETDASVRYFTFAFDSETGDAETVSFRLSAFTEEDAEEWARSLLSEHTGWTRGTYRYRVYAARGKTYVTVIDQGRELLPSYRILLISAIGLVLCTLLSWLVLRFVGRKLFFPLEEADRQQKQFVSNANRQFRLPLTVIGADTELIERTYGPDDQTRSIRRQVRKLNALVESLERMGVFSAQQQTVEISLSDVVTDAMNDAAERFLKCGKTLKAEIAPNVRLNADPGTMRNVMDELLDNAIRFAKTEASFRLRSENGLVVLEARNDADLSDGACDQVFDRFTTLSNAADEHVGLGLAYVKEAITAQHGRVSAKVENGVFTLRIVL